MLGRAGYTPGNNSSVWSQGVECDGQRATLVTGQATPWARLHFIHASREKPCPYLCDAWIRGPATLREISVKTQLVPRLKRML